MLKKTGIKQPNLKKGIKKLEDFTSRLCPETPGGGMCYVLQILLQEYVKK